MARINFARREIEVKVVYYGPAFSGKTTNVEILHRMMPATQRGELHTLRTDQDRTIFFDYAPINLGEIAGFKAKFKLFTVPGQTFYRETRRVMLQGADAVVFVADSDPTRRQANLESFADLEENLAAAGLDVATLPMVVQLNKRDHPQAAPAGSMAEELNPFDAPVVEATARQGRGVLDTLRRVTELAGARIREKLAGGGDAQVQLTTIERAEAEDDRAVVGEHLERIREVRARETAHVQRLQAAGAAPTEDPSAFLAARAVAIPDPAAGGAAILPQATVMSSATPIAARAAVPPVALPQPVTPPTAAAPTAAAPRVASPPAESRASDETVWVGAATAALIAGSVGVIVGIAIGWLAHAAIGG